MKSGDPLLQPPCSNRTTQDIAQGCVQTDFKYFQRGRLHKLPGQSIPGFHPHPNEKKCSLMFRGNLLCPSLCPQPLLVLVHWAEPGFVLCPPSLQVFLFISKSPLSLLFSSPNSQSLLKERCSSPLIPSVTPNWSLSRMSRCLLLWGAQNWPQDSRDVLPEGKHHILWPAGIPLPNSHQGLELQAYPAGSCVRFSPLNMALQQLVRSAPHRKLEGDSL